MAAAVREAGSFRDLGKWKGKFGKETVIWRIGRVREVVREGLGVGACVWSGGCHF